MPFKKKLAFLLGALILFAFIVVMFLNTQRGGEKTGRPNVLLISLDACRADHLGCYGYHRATSPFLDELASRGIRFENAFINALGTPSSHKTMFTSLYEQTHSKVLWDLFTEQGLAKGFSYAVSGNIVMLQEVMKANHYSTIGVTGGKVFKLLKFDKGFDAFAYMDKERQIELGAEKLVNLVKKYCQKNTPIYAFFHTYEIHTPYLPPENYRTKFGKSESGFDPTSEALLPYIHNASKLSASDLEYIKMMYDAEIRYTDDTLREMFRELEEVGFFDNYLLIITADHGEEFGDHGGMLHSEKMYDEILHVPMIVVGSNIPEGQVHRRLVSTVDIMPTILSFAGIEIDTPTEGENLFSGNVNPDDTSGMVFSQCRDEIYSLRTHEWKFIEFLDPPKMELYNLHNDPEEKSDISKKRPELCKKFGNILEQWRSSRIEIFKLKKEKIEYSPEDVERLRTLGYVE